MSRIFLTGPVRKQPKQVVSGAVARLVEKRAAVIDDKVARLRFMRRWIAAHEAATEHSQAARHVLRRRVYLTAGISAVALLAVAAWVLREPGKPASRLLPGTVARQIAAAVALPKVWLVERQAKIEIYSNGLRIDNEFLTSTRTRAYSAFDRMAWRESAVSTQPVGIVFHTTESGVAPFEPSQNSRLRRAGHNLLAYVAQRHLYHFVIDRFGRVFRVVAETDYANHAGQSIWADERNIYWGLNHSFLGIAFEAQTDGQSADANDTATRAQIDAARVLTEMLRSKYGIAEINCVTHAQVSVNPKTMRLGAHTDWAANFPFREVGLPDGYLTPIAALTLFGFDYDSAFLQANGRHVWQGLVSAEEQLIRDAAAHGTTVESYRRGLRKKFQAWKASQAQGSAEEGLADRT